mgnify:CR=1 FL=1
MQVGLIGAGVMGSAIGARLLESGCALAFYDLSPNAGGELLAAGARRAANPADAARGAEFVITSLNSAAVVESGLLDRPAQEVGPDEIPIGGGASSGRVTIEGQTVDLMAD